MITKSLPSDLDSSIFSRSFVALVCLRDVPETVPGKMFPMIP